MSKKLEERNNVMRNMFRREGYTMQAIADVYKISRERVSQIVNPNKDFDSRELRRKRVIGHEETIKEIPNRLVPEYARKMRMTISAIEELRRGFRSAPNKGTNAYKNWQACVRISEMLAKEGVENKIMPMKHAYDLAAGNKKILVKVSESKCITYAKQKSPMYKFSLYRTGSRRNRTCDYYVLYVKERNEIYILPSGVIGTKDCIYISYPSRKKNRYDQWLGRFDLLKEV